MADATVRIIGHDWAVDLFKRQYQAGRVPHALLISGPPHVGKSTLGHFFAQFLNCQAGTEAPAQPCGACLACRKVSHGSHPDVRLLEDDGQTLKIDQIRDLQRELSLSPYEGRYRVVVLSNFERATISAANALLKTLEEPAAQVVLILTAIDPGSLLPTIVSRCQGMGLRPLPLPQVVAALQSQWQAAPAQAELLAQLSAGRLGWAVQALQNEALLSHRQSCLEDLLDLVRMNRVERLAYAQGLSHNQAVLKETLLVWLTIWRDLLLLQSGSTTNILNLDWQEQLRLLAAQGSLNQAQMMVERLRQAVLNLDHHVNARLNLEIVLLKMPTYQFVVD
jgi:DNA polymerase-3 subunit delta'